jgi:hypothetical protein
MSPDIASRERSSKDRLDPGSEPHLSKQRINTMQWLSLTATNRQNKDIIHNLLLLARKMRA